MISEKDDSENVDACDQHPMDVDFIEAIAGCKGKSEPKYKFSDGLCLIFNHELFDNKPKREGTNVDRDNLIKMFKKRLGFTNVECFQDFTKSKIEECLDKYASDSCDINYDCLVCFVLTHGNQDTLWAKDRAYRNDIIHTKFKTSETFTKLRGKPKLFFYVACQGPEINKGIEIQFDATKVPFVPEDDDFLLVLSSIPGFRSRRSDTKGTVYVRKLLLALDVSIRKKWRENTVEDIHAILTTTNRLVAFKYENFDKRSNTRIKQMPIFFSTFRDDFFIARNAQKQLK